MVDRTDSVVDVIEVGAKPSSKAGFKKPVRWLLGARLVAALKWILIYTLYGEKLDKKMWMKSVPIDLSGEAGQSDEYWFDYMADTGDSQLATYNMAYLCMSTLWRAGTADRDEPLTFDTGAEELPPGGILLVGGDTCYHIADYPTLIERFYRPFHWAAAEHGVEHTDQDRTLLGIPGNHDYYDFLDGFNRQFLEPLVVDKSRQPGKKINTPQLEVPGFKKRQTASYFRVKLPWNWCLWGLDTQKGKIDTRQELFFLSHVETDARKLIVATPEPTTVFGKYSRADSDIAQTFLEVGLPRPYLGPAERDHLPDDSCRLDIAGDTHHYARFWGQHAGNGSDPGDTTNNYSSVVSGGGGAFLHSTQTDVGEVNANALYPSKSNSHQAITSRLLDPRNILKGGFVWLAGALSAASVYFSVHTLDTVRSFANFIFEKLTGFSQMIKGPASEPLLSASNRLNTGSETPFGGNEMWLLLVTTILPLTAVLGMALLNHIFRTKNEKTVYLPLVLVIVLLAPLAVMMGNSGSHGLVSSAAFGAHTMFVVMILAWTSHFRDYIFADAKRPQGEQAEWYRRIGRLRFILWIVIIFAVGLYIASAFAFGDRPLVNMILESVFLLFIVLFLIGLPFLGYFAGGHLRGLAGRLGFAALGLWLGILGLMLPFLIATFGDVVELSIATVAVLIIVFVVHVLCTTVFRDPGPGSQFTLTAAWVSMGIVLLYLFRPHEPAHATDWYIVVAFIAGAVIGCVMLGWYFAVSLAFNGHNNEAGGGARVEKYKHFIRFKLQRDKLTGYVIAIDDLQVHGKDLQPKIVDIFEIGTRTRKPA